MGIRGLKKWALLLTFWVALQSRWVRATDLTGGNLTLTGTADIQGNIISLGAGATSYPGWQGAYTDGTTSYVDFTGTRSANIWRWWQNGSGTPQLQLTLDNNNKLTLYDQSSTPAAKITLDPLGTSTFANSLTVNGANNQMPNQTLTGTYSVLTEGLADSRYVSSSSIGIGSVTTSWGASYPTTSLNGGTATAGYSYAQGWHTTASGYFSSASGYYSAATNWGATASGYFSIASGDRSTAMGSSQAIGTTSTSFGASIASGYVSTSMGASTASGQFSTSMGQESIASGDYSTATGRYTVAQAYDSFAIGIANVGLNASGGAASATSWVSTDPLFEIGNGTPGTYSSNYVPMSSDALVVYKNGNTAIQGTLTTGGSITTSGTLTASGLSVTGSITTTGTINAACVMVNAPSGDIPMFGH